VAQERAPKGPGSLEKSPKEGPSWPGKGRQREPTEVQEGQKRKGRPNQIMGPPKKVLAGHLGRGPRKHAKEP
jgi:hypothetical protein